MSTLQVSTANRIGVRRKYGVSRGMGTYRGPAEAPPVAALFRTRPLAGFETISSQPITYRRRSMGAMETSYASAIHAPTGSVVGPIRVASILSQEGLLLSPSTEEGPVYASGGATQASPYNPNGTPVATGYRPRWQRQGAPSSQSSATQYYSGTTVPQGASTEETYTDAYDNVWEYTPSMGWQVASYGTGQGPTQVAEEASNPPVSSQSSPTPTAYPPLYYSGAPTYSSGAATTAQAGTPVPVGWPTTEAYTDSSGNVWTYTAGYGWQITSNLATEEAAQTAAVSSTSPGTTVTLSTASSTWSDITTWLQEETVIPNVPNFFLVAGVGLVALFLYNRGGRR